MIAERPVVFPCAGDYLVGIVHPSAGVRSREGVVIVVGGPQYRVGSHRLFVTIARHLARHGRPVLRFDYRGAGDSDGTYLGFEHVGEDIKAAVNALIAAEPQVSRVMLWGLCDAAAAILLHASLDPRIDAVVLLNPWVRSASGFARTQIRHYYANRVGQADFWRKLFTARLDLRRSVGSVVKVFGAALGLAQAVPPGDGAVGTSQTLLPVPARSRLPLPDRMRKGLDEFRGDLLLVMSGRDLTAREFDDVVHGSAAWRTLLASPRVTRRDLPDADHTFSTAGATDAVAQATQEWLDARSGAVRLTPAA